LGYEVPHIAAELGFDWQQSTTGPDTAAATGAGSFELIDKFANGWLALTLVLAAIGVALWDRIWLPALVCLGIASFAAVWLTAGIFEGAIAAASAARWAAAIYALVWGAVFIVRDELRMAARRLPWLRWSRF